MMAPLIREVRPPMEPFTIETRIRWQDCDAAGVIFYPRLFVMVHDAWEELMAGIGWRLRDVLDAGELLLPVVHAEADYLGPARLGDPVRITLALHRLGESAFTLGFRITSPHGEVVARGESVQVAVDAASFRKRPLPEALRTGLVAVLGEPAGGDSGSTGESVAPDGLPAD
jgi:YbgC/YbaW family acyl-CoA thioester hydrolase